MPRVKRGVGHVKHRKNLMKRVKGYQAGRKNLIKLAKTAELKAGARAFKDRRIKKRTMRALFQVNINAAVREQGIPYSKFMAMLKAKGIMLDRKVLSQLAAKEPAIFNAIVAAVK